MKKNTLLTSLVPLWVYPLTTLALTGFVRLITNPNGKARYGSISDESHPLVKIRKYLHFILTGNDGDAFCPFVRLIERKNAYFVRLHSGALTRTMLNESVLDLENAFHALSNCVGKGESVTDPTTVVVGFLDKNVSSEKGPRFNGRNSCST
jgi:hypothetical protein